MLENLKNYIDMLYNWAKDHAKDWRDIENFRGQAYGALMFCIHSKYVDYDKAINYWETMWDKFHKLNDEIAKG